MAETQSEKKKGGLTRGKAALIGILSVVLVGVLYLQFGGGDDESSADAAAYTPRRRAGIAPTATAAAANPAANSSQSQSTPTAEVPTVIDPAKWKQPDLNLVVSHDPFALPASFPQTAKVVVDPNAPDGDKAALATAAENSQKLAEAVEMQQAKLTELKQRGVHVIIRDRERDQYAAMIGDRMVYVGDEIEGFVVKKIGPDSVQIEGKVVQ